MSIASVLWAIVAAGAMSHVPHPLTVVVVLVAVSAVWWLLARLRDLLEEVEWLGPLLGVGIWLALGWGLFECLPF